MAEITWPEAVMAIVWMIGSVITFGFITGAISFRRKNQ